MAVVLVGNGAAAGFIAAIETTRPVSAKVATDAGYVALAAATLAYKTEFLALNALAGVPLADANTVSMAELVYAATVSALEGRSPPIAASGGISSTAGDYANVAAVALAIAIANIANFS